MILYTYISFLYIWHLAFARLYVNILKAVAV